MDNIHLSRCVKVVASSQIKECDMKYGFTIICSLLSCLLVTGCGQKKSSDEASSEKSSITIGAIPKSTGGEFWETVENANITNLWWYSAWEFNCQRFQKEILNANGIFRFNSFIIQDIRELAPSYLKYIMNFVEFRW